MELTACGNSAVVAAPCCIFGEAHSLSRNVSPPMRRWRSRWQQQLCVRRNLHACQPNFGEPPLFDPFYDSALAASTRTSMASTEALGGVSGASTCVIPSKSHSFMTQKLGTNHLSGQLARARAPSDLRPATVVSVRL